MKVIRNVNETLKDDLALELQKGSMLSIVAADFSMYAFEALRKELSEIEELRFIFTSPAFVAEKAKKEKENSTFLVFTGNAVFMVLSLKLSLGMSLHRRLLQKNVLIEKE